MQDPKSSAMHYVIGLPSDLDYIPPLRHFISEIARIEGFPKKFCFRTEILVDELCSNAIIHGSQDIRSTVGVLAEFSEKELRLTVQDQGGSKKNLDNLRKAIGSGNPQSDQECGKGLVIVQMLSNELNLRLEDNGQTEVHVVRRRDSDFSKPGRETTVYESDV